jgi:hypothetical protein
MGTAKKIISKFQKGKKNRDKGCQAWSIEEINDTLHTEIMELKDIIIRKDKESLMYEYSVKGIMENMKIFNLEKGRLYEQFREAKQQASDATRDLSVTAMERDDLKRKVDNFDRRVSSK